MKNKICCLVLSLMVSASISLPAFATDVNETMCFYVDVNAMDGGNGNIDAPFNSVFDAQKAVREVIKSGNYPDGGITVFLREGEYKFDESLKLTAEDSGKEGAPVVWRSYWGEDVTITNGAAVKFAEFKKASNENIPTSAKDKVYFLNLPENEIAGHDGLHLTGHSQHYFWAFGMADPGEPQFGTPVPEVFMGDAVGVIARYPNEGQYMLTGRCTDIGSLKDKWYTDDFNGHKIEGEMKGFTMQVNDARISNWKNAKNPWVWGLWYVDWSDFATPLANIDISSKTITTKYPSPFPPNENQRWYIYNLIEELDSPGEWFYDEDTGDLFIYPPENIKDDTNITLAFRKVTLIDIDDAENLVIRDLHLTGTRGEGMTVDNSDNIDIYNIDVDYISGSAILIEGGKNVTVRSCHVHTVGRQGIVSEAGDYLKREKANHIIQNNWVHNYSRLVTTYNSGVGCGGCGITLKNNLIHDAPHLAMSVGGCDIVVEKNEIYDVLKNSGDAGAIYSGRSMMRRGNVIRQNVIHDLKTDTALNIPIFGVYLDDSMSGWTVEENVFYNIPYGAGMFLNYGRDNNFWNNICANVQIGTKINYWKDYPVRVIGTYPEAYEIDEEIVRSEAYSDFPNILTLLEDEWCETRYNVVKNNLYYNVEGNLIAPGTPDPINEDWLKEHNEIEEAQEFGDPSIFKDVNKNDFTIADMEKVNEKLPEFKRIDMSKISTIDAQLRVLLEGDSVVFLKDSPMARIDLGNKIINEDNAEIKAFKRNCCIYIPLRFAMEEKGAEVEWNDKQKQINAFIGSDSYTLIPNEMRYIRNGKEGQMFSEVIVIDGTSYISCEDYARIFEYEKYVTNDGLVILGQKGITEKLDDEMLDELTRSLR